MSQTQTTSTQPERDGNPQSRAASLSGRDPRALAALPYTPRALAAALGVPVERIIKLNANESVYGPPPAALGALADYLARGPVVGRYPDWGADDLRAALAEYTGVAAERIVAGNGSDELIELLAGAVLSAGDEVVVCEPTFGRFASVARRCGGVVISVPLDDGFGVPIARVRAAISPRTRLVILCGPNNPTGTPLDARTIEALVDLGPLLVVDEAYFEFARAGAPRTGTTDSPPGQSPAAALVSAGRSVVVLRTFSKAFGLAGLRVGYALCPTAVAEAMRARKAAFNVNAAAQVAARAALGQLGWVMDRAAATVRERERLAARLAALPGLRVYPSAANFVLVEWTAAPNAEGSAPLLYGLRGRGILVTRFEQPRLAACLRITVGSPEENDAVAAGLAELLGAAPDQEGAGQPDAEGWAVQAAGSGANGQRRYEWYGH